MPNKKPKSNKKARSIKGWSLYSALHNDVLQLLQEDNLTFKFHNDDNDDNSRRDYDTNIMGQFACRNHACHANGWASKRIPVTIRMYDGQRYNARVYHQRCRQCNSLSRPTLDSSYAERVAYRLKVWCGIPMQPPNFVRKPAKKPHASELCEGCKAGHCREG
ncbi:hypothetical protein CGRA01v4_12197 [Colletotrichum graminicola]|uniref:3CxxC-type domain-containing protein n=1 Tax=Colletotrichum graminicola (strain M1.001 / M2 / FGSC 10212) TaxID=645133 RepID=E3R0K0_COLGM|nr:uncharacterized protein GLRG_11783 [Colletotrichum graminicola M1.001]EFQ36638.1 hypothetical protein GLRG_11783 [Colletotrichum graminicola M1.001]WDK20908.1 hypothetical protein CGRA01v4_12197 [Colletotrichum graminicola]